MGNTQYPLLEYTRASPNPIPRLAPVMTTTFLATATVAMMMIIKDERRTEQIMNDTNQYAHTHSSQNNVGDSLKSMRITRHLATAVVRDYCDRRHPRDASVGLSG